MSKKVEQMSEYEVEFSGQICPAERDVGINDAYIEDLYVGVIIKGQSIDITDKLTDKQRDHFEELLREEAVDNEIAARENAADLRSDR
jgi:hypothetical protein